MISNSDLKQILERVHHRYRGIYQKGELSRTPKVEFMFNNRNFIVGPDLTSRTSSSYAWVTGISFHCSTKSSISFWVTSENPFDVLGRWLRIDRRKRLKDPISDQYYIFHLKNRPPTNLLFENAKFVRAFDQLAHGMRFLNLKDGWLWYANKRYEENLIDKLSALANVLEN